MYNMDPPNQPTKQDGMEDNGLEPMASKLQQIKIGLEQMQMDCEKLKEGNQKLKNTIPLMEAGELPRDDMELQTKENVNKQIMEEKPSSSNQESKMAQHQESEMPEQGDNKWNKWRYEIIRKGYKELFKIYEEKCSDNYKLREENTKLGEENQLKMSEKYKLERENTKLREENKELEPFRIFDNMVKAIEELLNDEELACEDVRENMEGDTFKDGLPNPTLERKKGVDIVLNSQIQHEALDSVNESNDEIPHGNEDGHEDVSLQEVDIVLNSQQLRGALDPVNESNDKIPQENEDGHEGVSFNTPSDFSQFLPSVCTTCEKPSFERFCNCSASCGPNAFFFSLFRGKNISLCRRKFFIMHFLMLLALNLKKNRKLKFKPYECTSFVTGLRRLGLVRLIFDRKENINITELDGVLIEGLKELPSDSIGLFGYDTGSYQHCLSIFHHKHGDEVKMMIYDAQNDELFPKYAPNLENICHVQLLVMEENVNKWLEKHSIIDNCYLQPGHLK